jgi:hypothetical protein
VGRSQVLLPRSATEKIFSLIASVIFPAADISAEENTMNGFTRNLACGIFLLALVGTASAGCGTAKMAGTAAPWNLPHPGFSHLDGGLLAITGYPGDGNPAADVREKCYFPIWRLPAYYVCIMFCKMGGGGNSCPASCEAKLTICTYY